MKIKGPLVTFYRMLHYLVLQCQKETHHFIISINSSSSRVLYLNINKNCEMFSTAEVGCILSFLMTLYSTKSVYFPSDLNDFLELDEETRYTDIYCSSTMTYMNTLWGVHSCSLTPPFGRPMLSEALSFALLTPPPPQKIKIKNCFG